MIGLKSGNYLGRISKGYFGWFASRKGLLIVDSIEVWGYYFLLGLGYVIN